MTAEAEAYAVRTAAEAEAQQTRVVASAIADDGGPAINYEIAKRQVQALSEVGAADNSKTIVIPTNITETLGTLSTLFETVNRGDGSSS